MMEQIRRAYDASFGLYGTRKIWHQLRREGIKVAKCTVERLMRAMGLAGIVRGKNDNHRQQPQGAVSARQGQPVIQGGAPERPLGRHFTYVHTWAGFVYVAFVIDAFARRIVGWKVSTSATAGFVLDALGACPTKSPIQKFTRVCNVLRCGV